MPAFYLSKQTTMLETRDPLHVIPYPQLAEMTYLFPVFIGQKDSARFIHFGFYFLIVLLLITFAREEKNAYARFTPLLFVTAPVVMRYARAQYIDFFMVFCFLLSILLLKKNGSLKTTILSGFILGGALATKMWVLVYLPAVIGYI